MWQVAWVKRGSQSLCICKVRYVHKCIAAWVCECVHVYMQVWADIQKQEIEKLIKEEREKKFMYAYWHTCESSCVVWSACVPVTVFEVRRKETCISAPMLYSAGLFWAERWRTFIYSFILQSTRTAKHKPTSIVCGSTQHFQQSWHTLVTKFEMRLPLNYGLSGSGLDLSTSPLWPLPVTWLDKLWPFATSVV